MNKFSLPASPNWYETAIVSCSSDNELFYGSNGDIVMIKPKAEHEVADIKTISNAHDRITALSVNVHWGSPEKLLVTIGEDKFVKLWDMKTFELRNSHNTHKENKSKLIGVTFPSDDRIISVSLDGLVVLWRPAANEISTFTHFFMQKVQVTAVSCCPHATWLAAFGLAKGHIVVADLRKSGKVLYNLRGHESNILSLVWCPTPYNIFPEQKRAFLTPRRNNVEITRKKTNNTAQIDNKTEETIKTSQEAVQSSQEIDKISQEIDTNSQEIVTNNLASINHAETIKEKFESLEISSSKSNIEKENNKQAANLVKSESKVGSGKPIKANPWANLKHADDEDFVEEKPDPRSENLAKIDDNDFLSECLALKYRILNENEEDSEDDCKDKSGCFSEEYKIIEEKSEENPIENVTSELKDTTESIKAQSDCKKTSNTDEIEKITDNTEEIEEITDNMTALTTGETILTTENGNCSKNVVVVPRKEFLLASAGKGSSIMIWRAGTDGRIQLELIFPVSKSTYHRNKFQKETKNWIALSWIRPNILLSSSPKGELLQWDLLKYEGNGRNHISKLVHHDHKKRMFAMGAVVPLFPIHSTEWPTDGMNVWSFAQDRKIHRTTLDAERDTLSSYPTFGGTVHSMANSTIDPNRIAFGIGESHIKLWNVSKAHFQVVGMTPYSPKNMGRITNLAWHPVCEATLAFATSDGKIGLVDVNTIAKAPTMFNTFFKGAVHKIEWGPLKGGEPDNYALYACGDGKLVYFEKDTPTKVPVQINLEHENIISHMAWQPSQSHLTTPTQQLLAVATKDAVSITLFNSQLLVLRILYLQEKTICSMQWHPSKSEEEEGEDCSQWLAVVTNGHSVVVLELRGDTRGGMMVDNDEESCSKEIIANLKGHTRPVQGICWSPYDNGKLISVSDDSLAIIWDVKSGNMLSTYISGYADPIYSVLWSPINPDLIITVGRGSLNIWSIKEHPAKSLTDLDLEIKELTKQKNQYLTRINEKTTVDLANISTSNATEGTKPKPKISRDKLLSVVSRFQGTSEYTLEDCRKMIQLQENEAKNIDKEKSSTSTVLQLFGERDGVIKLLNMQQKQHTQRGKHEYAQHLSLWKGDLSETIKKAIENKTVTPWLISLAPMVSPTLWQLACRSFADQSSENDADCDAIQIAGYYLAGGGDDSLDMAVKALCNGSLYREALALVKCRQVAEIHEGDGDNADKDKMVNTVLSQWASNALTKGSFEIAAQCFIALKNYDEAAKVLFKRSDLEAIKLSLDLAKKGTNLDLISAVESRFDMFKGETNNTLEKSVPLLEKRTEIVDEKKSENVDEKKIEIVDDKKIENIEEKPDITEEQV